MEIEKLFKNAAIKAEPRSTWLRGACGSKLLHQLLIKVVIAPLRRSHYSGADRVGATTVGYRLELGLESIIPVRFSVLHAGITGARLVAWMNRRKGLHRVSYAVTDNHNLEVWCSDADWARRLLDINEANSAIVSLLECEKADARVGHPCVFISPLKATYYRRAASLRGFSRLGDYLNDFATVYNFARDMSPPLNPSTTTKFERLANRNPLLVGGLLVISGLMLIPALLVGLVFLFV